MKDNDFNFLLYDSDVETIPEESLKEYKISKPMQKPQNSFNRKYYLCPYCKDPQYSLDNLKEHVVEIHDKPFYSCHEKNCKYVSARRSDIIIHEKNHNINIKTEL